MDSRVRHGNDREWRGVMQFYRTRMDSRVKKFPVPVRTFSLPLVNYSDHIA
uniref:Uncharacterized protein n=1 Tax=Chlorobium phaeobacteroides (strain BS1) TaxID=331678 RepID=B3EPC9_CHLPB